MSPEAVPVAEYVRSVLIATLTAHQRLGVAGTTERPIIAGGGCMCGHAAPGASHSHHVADRYENALTGHFDEYDAHVLAPLLDDADGADS